MANHTVRVPAEFWDIWQSKLTTEEFCLLMAIARKTYGFDKMVDIVSTSQLVLMTGMLSRTVRKYMASLLKSGVPVEVVGRGKNGTMYRILDSDSVSTDRMQESTPLLQTVPTDRTHRGFTSIRSVQTATTVKNRQTARVAEVVNKQSAQVTEQLPIRAASQELPVKMPLSVDSSEAGSLLSKEGSEAAGSLLNKEGLVEDASHTQQKDLATATACASPAAQDTPELTSSPRSWAGRPENQPEATKQTPPPVPPAPLPFELAAADDEED